jgi:hypothetical protein
VITLSTTTTVHSLSLASGTLSGPGDLTVSGPVTWSGGAMAGTGSTTANGGLTINTSAAKTLDGRTLNNASAATWTDAGGINISNDATFNNLAGGTVNIQNNASFAFSSGVNPTFNNQGTVRKSVGTGTTTFTSGIAFNNSGTVDLQTGTLVLAGGGSSSGAFTGAGGTTLNFFSGLHLLGSTSRLTSSGAVIFSGGFINLSGSYNVTGSTTVTNQPNLPGATVNFLGPVASVGTTLTVNSGVANFTTDTMLTTTTVALNGGTTAFTPASTLTTTTLTMAGGTATLPGTVTVTGTGSGSLTASGGLANFPGTVTVAGNTLVSGGTANFSGGMVTLGNALTVSRGTANFTGATVSVGPTLTISGGTANFSNSDPITTTTVTLSQPSNFNPSLLTGSDSLTTTGIFTWVGGTIAGTGVTNIDTGAVLNISTSAPKALDRRTINNAGIATWTDNGDNVSVSAGIFNNLAGATFAAQNDAGFLYPPPPYNGPALTFNNLGLFRKSVTPATTTMQVVFNNTGTVEVATGVLYLSSGGSSSGSFSVTTGTTLNFGPGTHALSADSSITGAGSVVVSAGLINVNGAYDIAATTSVTGGTVNFRTSMVHLGNAFQISGGTANFTGDTVLVDNNITQSGGTANFSNTTPITVPFLAQSQPSNFNPSTLTGSCTITVTVLFDWTGGTLSGTGTTNIDTNAALDISTPTAKALDTRTLNNAGTATWTDTGNITASAGTLNNLAGATFNVQNDAAFLYPPPPYNGPALIFNNLGLFRKSVTPQTTTMQVVFNNSGTVDVRSGFLVLSLGGSQTGSFTLQRVATLNFGGGAHTLTVDSSISGDGMVGFSAGSVTINGSYNLSILGSTFVSGALVNFPGDVVNLGGTLTVSAGMVNFTGHTVTVPLAINITGGTANFSNSDPITTQDGILNQPSNFNPATLTGSNTITYTGTVSWSGGTMNGAGTINIDTTGALNIGSAALKVLDGRTINNAGTTTWTDSGNVQVSNGTFNNLANALFNVRNNAAFVYPPPPYNGPVLVFNNAGTFRKTVTPAGTTMQVIFNNTGTVDVQTGSLSLIAGGTSTGNFNVLVGLNIFFAAGTFTLNDGVTITGAGFVQAAGVTVVIGGGVSAQNYQMVSGTLTGPGTLTVEGVFNWQGGTMSGMGTTFIDTPGTMNITTAAAKTLDNRILTNAGTVTWTWLATAAPLSAGNGAVVNNLAGATFNAINDTAVMAHFADFGPLSPTFLNAGTFTKSGSGTVRFDAGVRFTNSGAMQIQNGTLSLAANYTQMGTDASTTLAAGTTLGSDRFMNILGGTLSGTGTVNAAVINRGQVTPGGPGTPGTLTINGTYNQTREGVLNISLGGTGAGQFSRLVVQGSARLNGTLNVALIDPYMPSVNDQFPILAFTSSSGDFAVENGLNLGGGLRLDPQYSATNLTLVTVASGAPGGYGSESDVLPVLVDELPRLASNPRDPSVDLSGLDNTFFRLLAEERTVPHVHQASAPADDWFLDLMSEDSLRLV